MIYNYECLIELNLLNVNKVYVKYIKLIYIILTNKIIDFIHLINKF